MAKYLDMIESPADIKRFRLDQLQELAREIRKEIIEVCGKTGGHLASSLGAVELVLAIHYVFNTPQDKVVWDVGHQTYAHKLITGRRDRFHTLRQYQGLCGFTHPEESEYDAFIAGHSGTAISAALGMAVGRDLRGETAQKVIAVIGDATLTGGISFEGLNNAGHAAKNFLVILNDNKMAIAPNVGAISQYLNRILTSDFYNRMKKKTEGALEKIPRLGPQILKATQKMEEGIKGLIVPGVLFEEMGFRYLGPVDGHDLGSLIKMFEMIKREEQPIFLHTITVKGKGYKFSEEDPQTFHGIPAFNTENGEMVVDSVPTFTSVFGSEMISIAQKDSRVVGITAAMPHGTGMIAFAEKFPNRFFDVGIAEAHAVTFAAGLAAKGFRPFVAIYSSFMQRAVDQIFHDVCLQNLPVVLCMDRAGIAGEDGATHQGAFDIGYLRNLPNLVLMQPKDGDELRTMMRLVLEHPGPVAIRYPKGPCKTLPGFESVSPFRVGQGQILREGKDGQLVVLGSLIHVALEVAKRFSAQGLEWGVLNARFVKPLDRELLRNVCAGAKRIVTLEEGALLGGFGSAVLEFLQEEKIEYGTMVRLGFPDRYVPHGNRAVLLKTLGLDVPGVYQTIQTNYFPDSIVSFPKKDSSPHSDNVISLRRA